jgi:hypothetical protein
MQYTKEQLDAMGYHDITLAVAKKLGLETKVYTNRHSSFVEIKNEYNSWDCFEPCDRWDDVMPIAIENGIGLAQMANGNTRAFCYTAFIDKRGNRVGFLNNDHPNPRRAICEVFLMIQKE